MPQIGIPRNSTNWDPQGFHKVGSPGIPQIGIPRNSTHWDPQEFHKLGSPGIPNIGRKFGRFQKSQHCSQLVNIVKHPSGIFQNMQNPGSLFRIFSKIARDFQNPVRILSNISAMFKNLLSQRFSKEF
jgi:hypothetical protein